MRTRNDMLKTALLVGIALLSTVGVAQAQNSVSLTAARQTALMPDGASVPMWGWVCSTTTAAVGATCTQTNGAAQTVPATGTSTVWQPPLIRVPAAVAPALTSLTITLANMLPVATSLVIVGQIPQAADVGRLGAPVRESGRPQHPAQTATTWTIATPTDPVNGPVAFQPPSQGARARSFVAEALASTGTATYTFTNLRPGTYLIESGTYPAIQGPMGLYGVLVVTTAPVAPAAGTGACTGTISAAAEMTKWSLACSTMGPTTTANTCYPPAVDYTPLYYLIDGVAFDPANPSASQLNIGSTTTSVAVSTGVLLRLVNAGLRFHMPSTVGLQMVQMAEDGNLEPDVAVALTTGHYAQSATGVTFTQTAATTTTPQPKVVSDVFMPAGKVIDVLVFPASAGASYALFDRELSLSAGSIKRDSGMEAFLVVNGGAVGTGAGQTTGGLLNAFATASAVADNYIVPAHATTFAGNVLANDIGVHNASSPCVPTTGSTGPQTVATSGSAFGAVTLSPDGSFAVTGIPTTFSNGAQATFSYCGNGNSAVSAIVTFYAARLGGAPTANADTYTSAVANLLQVGAPGVLLNDTDPNGYPLTAASAGAGTGGCTVSLQVNGAFTASLPALTTPAARTCTFSYNAVNSQSTASAAEIGRASC